MFVDASAIVALLSDEPEAQRVSDAVASARSPFTSPVALLECVLSLARQDKFNLPVPAVEPIVMQFLQARSIEVRDLPPAAEVTRLALLAADRYRSGRHGLNLGDCLHYACAKFYNASVLATADEFRATDLQTVP
ncbi:type II toxin-antitoxin system VapC family toxin [Aliirhizobium terrae]|uniref:type II toxin-antitoxin system VapC family toxin n=1 Tax=Terrirhizobium terrae TaxID=2926709 RepID=UPI002578B19D|nr:type II toxin-antitoxin system VapC family toxin [Rhizobium sp. CC-CFT758]WJH40997.1 type II toxin-antitoxin system VapC family toxin [Rhizobium sp. CC-CFT758]